MSLGQNMMQWWRGVGRLGIRYSETRSVDTIARRDVFDIHTLHRSTRSRSEAIIRGACQSAYLHEHDAVCRCLGRYRLFVATDDIGLSTFIMLDGYWEMAVTETFVELIKPGMTVVDCGANLGYYSILAADLVGTGGHVHIIEPQPDLMRRVRASLSVNGYSSRATLHNVALGDVEADVVLHIPAGEPKNGHWTDIQVADANSKTGLISVPQHRLDELLNDTPIDLIKIDVEGSELRLWKGMTKILERKSPLIILLEFAADRYDDPRGFLEEMMRHRFVLHIISDDRGICPTSIDEIISAPINIDQMILLRR